MADKFKRCLKPHFKNVKELRFNVSKLNENSWAYINWLQTDKVLILPKFNIPEDEQAFHQIEKLIPDYKGRIEMVDATDLICYEGCLNCASWTIQETSNREIPTVKNRQIHGIPLHYQSKKTHYGILGILQQRKRQ